jgi:PRTRC genetic system protein B
LIFRARERELSLAAVPGLGRPPAEEALYHAPLMNVYASTTLCPGTAVLPRSHTLADRAAFEAAVFDTGFTHVNQPQTLYQPDSAEVTTAQHERFWTQLARSGTPEFPSGALVRLHRNLSDWLEGR